VPQAELVVMRRLLLLFIFLLTPMFAFAQTADDIIAKYVEARGGLAKIKSIQSERMRGTLMFAPGIEGPFLVERERPYKMRMEVSFRDQTLIRVYDGKSSGWIYNPFAANASVEAMSENDLRNILDEADFEGPFIDYKAKGNQLEYAGKTDVEGKPAYKIKLTNKGGDVSYFSFDASTFFLVRWQGNRKTGDKEVPWESYFRDFREIDGLQYPFLVESSAPGTDQVQKIMADKIEVNVTISESRFKKPIIPVEAPAAPSAPATPPPPQPNTTPSNPAKPN
jgi:outer membrane lipoprotein-sorting protein